MIIDFHTHAFGEQIAARAMASLTMNSGTIHSEHDGTPASLTAHLDKYGADYAVVANIATKPSQQRVINDFAKSINAGKLIPFGSVHPDAPDAVEELYYIKELGLKGIKLHPDYQRFFVDDDKALPIYEKCVELGLIVLFHAGVDISLPPPTHCTPQRLAHVLPIFEQGVCVAAHLGGYMMWDDVLKYLCGRRLYFDTAFTVGRIPVYLMREIVDAHGEHNILLATDLPWLNLGETINSVRAVVADDEKFNLIAGENARRILGL